MLINYCIEKKNLFTIHEKLFEICEKFQLNFALKKRFI